jgi:hypothetical protein
MMIGIVGLLGNVRNVPLHVINCYFSVFIAPDLPRTRVTAWVGMGGPWHGHRWRGELLTPRRDMPVLL